MAKRERRRARRRVAKKSFLESLFTFPKVLVYAFAVLSAITIYQISLPGASVKGTSTIESTFKYKLKMIIYKDANQDANRQNSEDCLAKTYKVKIDGVEKTLTGNNNCNTYSVPIPTVKGYCHTVSYVNNSLSNWTITGIKYSDSNHYGKILLGKSSVKVCVYPPAEGLNIEPAAIINFGLKQK